MLYSLAKEGNNEMSICPNLREEEEEEEDEVVDEDEWEVAKEWNMGFTNPVFSHQGAKNITTHDELLLPNTKEEKEEGSKLVISEGMWMGGG